MKKLIAFLLAAALLQAVAYADINSYITECGTDGNVTLTGTLDNSDIAAFVGIRILKKGAELEGLTGDPAEDIAVTELVDQAEVKESAFSFQFVLPDGETGLRKARLKSNASDILECTLRYVTQGDYLAAVTEVNGAMSDFDTFKAVCEKNALCLGLDESLSDALDRDLAMRILYRSIDRLSTDDRIQTVRLWRAASLAAMLNKERINLSDYGGSLKYFDDTVTQWIDFISDTDGAAGKFQTLLYGQDYQSIDELEKRMKEALVLTITEYHNGVGNIGKVLKAFSDITNITLDSETAVYQKLVGSYSSLSDLLAKYKELKTAPAGDRGSSAGGGGTTGSSIRTDGSLPFAPAESIKLQFTDLDTVDWAYKAIMTLAEKGIVSGRTADTFAPIDSITREEFVKMLVCAAGYENQSYTAGKFTDVQAGAWYERYVCISAQAGLVSGIDDGQFGIGANISRQDMAVLIYRALSLSGHTPEEAELTFSDEYLIADYAKAAIGALSGSGLVSGVGDNRFAPEGTATRAEAAQMIYNFCSSVNKGGNEQ